MHRNQKIKFIIKEKYDNIISFQDRDNSEYVEKQAVKELDDLQKAPIEAIDNLYSETLFLAEKDIFKILGALQKFIIDGQRKHIGKLMKPHLYYSEKTRSKRYMSELFDMTRICHL